MLIPKPSDNRTSTLKIVKPIRHPELVSGSESTMKLLLEDADPEPSGQQDGC